MRAAAVRVLQDREAAAGVQPIVKTAAQQWVVVEVRWLRGDLDRAEGTAAKRLKLNLFS